MPSMRASSLFLFAALGSNVEGRAVKSAEIYSAPMKLKPGEVYNAWQPPIPLPDDLIKRFANKTMHMKSIKLDIVRVDAATGEEQSLRLDEVYNHHYGLVIGSADRMAKFYNKTKTEDDPLGKAGPEHHHGHGHASSHGHNHYGCMMSGASVQMLMDDINSIPANDNGRIASFGGASGAEFRGTPVALAGDYAFSSSGPEAFMLLIHFINMRGAPSVHEQRYECPCQKHMVIDPENGTVNGIKVRSFNCSTELLRQKNVGCGLESYQGGYRCCENGFFLTEEIPSPDTPTDEFFAKFTFSYWDEDEVPEARSVAKTSCCDATGNLTLKGNLEYTVPPCTPGTPPERCVHMITSLQTLDMMHTNTSTSTSPPANPDDMIELVHAWGHMHVGGMSMELYNDETGQLICETRPQYGAGTSPGDEDGYLVAIPPCVWGPPPLPVPPRLRKGTLMRTVARYNNTVTHYGVMSLWLMTAAPVPKEEKMAARDDMFV